MMAVPLKTIIAGEDVHWPAGRTRPAERLTLLCHGITEARSRIAMTSGRSAAPPACLAGRAWRRSAKKRKRSGMRLLRFFAESTRIRRFAASAQRSPLCGSVSLWLTLFVCSSYGVVNIQPEFGAVPSGLDRGR